MVFSITKTNRHEITEILLKVVFNPMNQPTEVERELSQPNQRNIMNDIYF
jgi:hypothetical protein